MNSAGIINNLADGIPSGDINVGSTPGTSVIEVVNESGFALQLRIGGNTVTLPAWTADIYHVDQIPGFGGMISFTPKAISTQVGTPSSSVILNTYGPGETLPKGYPLTLARLTNIGNGSLTVTSANSVNVSGETITNDLVRSLPSGYTSPTVDIKDDGSLALLPISNNTQTPALKVVAGDGTHFATVQMDNNTISTDGLGHLTAGSFNGPLGGGITSADDTINHTTRISPVEPLITRSLTLQSWDGSAAHDAFGVGTNGFHAATYIKDDGSIVAKGTTSLDTATITTDGSGNLAAKSLTGNNGTLTVSSQQSGAGNALHFQTWTGSAAATLFTVGDQTGSCFVNAAGTMQAGNGIFVGGSVDCDVYAPNAHTYIGFKNNSGGKIAEMRGDFVISGTTFWTTQTTSGFNHSASFDAFDVAEVYTTDQAYPNGTVVCPDEDGAMHQCTHDACPFALVVSKTPGFAIGGGHFSDEPDPIAGPHEHLAIAGRVRAASSGAVPFKAFVTSDGHGGVRALLPGEQAFALGYALHTAQEDSVGLMLRPMYLTAPVASTVESNLVPTAPLLPPDGSPTDGN